MRLSVTKKLTFEAAHHLTGGYIGKCQHPHGHSYIVYLTISASNDGFDCSKMMDRSGIFVDASAMKDMLREAVFDKYDHMDLNTIEPFTKESPSAENIVLAIAKALVKIGADSSKIADDGFAFVSRIELHETDTFSAALEFTEDEWRSNVEDVAENWR